MTKTKASKRRTSKKSRAMRFVETEPEGMTVANPKRTKKH